MNPPPIELYAWMAHAPHPDWHRDTVPVTRYDVRGYQGTTPQPVHGWPMPRKEVPR